EGEQEWYWCGPPDTRRLRPRDFGKQTCTPIFVALFTRGTDESSSKIYIKQNDLEPSVSGGLALWFSLGLQTRLQWKQPAADSDGDSVRPIVSTQFVNDVLDMKIDCVFRN